MNHDRLKTALRRARHAADHTWTGTEAGKRVPFSSIPTTTLNLLIKAATKELSRCHPN